MKSFILALACAGLLAAQTTEQTPIVFQTTGANNTLQLSPTVRGPVPVAVTVAIVDQGAEPIQQTTGVTVAGATLLDATVCNETDADATVDNAMVYQRINTRNSQDIRLVNSQIVLRVLEVFQDRNVYQKLFKGGTASATIGAVLLTAFKTSPLLATALQVGPAIYQAALPVVHSPADIADLAKDIMPQSSGGKLAGRTCRAGVVVARTTTPGRVKTEVMGVQ